MNIENLLKYQSVDGKLFSIEQKLAKSQHREKASKLSAVAKTLQNRSTELENEAEKLISEIDDIKSKYQQTKTQSDKMIGMDIEKMSMEEIEKFSNIKNKLLKNLEILERTLQKSAENVNKILAEFNKTKKAYEQARNEYTECKQKIDDESKEFEPKKEEIRKELAVLEGAIDAKELAEYKKKRNEGKFPVFVPLENGSFCGHCRMELPRIATTKIKELGVITCEHCKRFIYKA